MLTTNKDKLRNLRDYKSRFFCHKNINIVMAFEYGRSERGAKTVIFKNFEYVRECENVNGTTSWRCRFYKKNMCKARIVTDDARVVSEKQGEHTHSGNVATSLARKAVGEMKDKMNELMATPSTTTAAISVGLGEHVLMALPKRSLLTRTLQRKRQKLTHEANNNLVLPAVPTDLNFDIPQQYLDMVLYDSGPGEDRIIMLGCNELLDGLGRADVWLADGTFKIVPSLFFQLYSFHFCFGAGINPAALYCLLPNKTAATYGRVFAEIRNLVPRASPTKMLVDFEKAAMNSFSASYPDATVTGCYFHLCQSILRKVNEIGLKAEYETNNEVRCYVRCLSALAFIPPDDVKEAFEILMDTMPMDIDHLEELTSFFELTYVKGRRLRGRNEAYGAAQFPIAIWNQHAGGSEGIARTTNSVEGWHHGIQSLFLCSHPTLWTFLSGLKRDMQMQKATFLQGTSGTVHTSRKTYRELNGRVMNAVAAYGRADILTYLRSIAHLSHC